MCGNTFIVNAMHTVSLHCLIPKNYTIALHHYTTAHCIEFFIWSMES